MDAPPKYRPIDVVGNVVGLLVAIAFFATMGYGMYAVFKPQ